MTVYELMIRLQSLPPDAPVFVLGRDSELLAVESPQIVDAVRWSSGRIYENFYPQLDCDEGDTKLQGVLVI